MKNNFHYNTRLRTFARTLRSDPTKAENRLWYDLLCERRFHGLRFYRQRIIGPYIADFFCKEHRLVIEVDGFSHHLDEVIANDIKRENVLREMGYKVIRFSDDEVMKDLENVARTLEAACGL